MKCWPDMNSLCQFTFVQTLGRHYARSGITHPPAAGRRAAQKSQQRPPCVPQLILHKGRGWAHAWLTPSQDKCLIREHSTLLLPSWKHSRAQGKLPLPATLPFAVLLWPKKDPVQRDEGECSQLQTILGHYFPKQGQPTCSSPGTEEEKHLM